MNAIRTAKNILTNVVVSLESVCKQNAANKKKPALSHTHIHSHNITCVVDYDNSVMQHLTTEWRNQERTDGGRPFQVLSILTTSLSQCYDGFFSFQKYV